MTIELPPLPYPVDALEPHVSAETLTFHHDKHHRAYVEKTNELLAAHREKPTKLESIIETAPQGDLFNNAAQAWNHAFYWKSMKKGGGGEPSGKLADAVRRDFGSYSAFRKKFEDAATHHFGSGWTWLVLNGNRLDVIATHDADLPMKHGQKAMLACDVWEHAYYLDYKNARPKYVAAFLENLLNWEFVASNL